MKRLCTICARGGSKGVKGKNIRLIAGKPLISYTISQAKESGLFNYIAISSDSDLILQTASQYGANLIIKRPTDLAHDTAAKLPVIKHCVLEAEKMTCQTFDTFVDLDCTSPLRSIEDIINSVKLLENSTFSNIITGCQARRSPYFNMVEINSTGNVQLCKNLSHKIVRRQDAPRCYDMNASIYVWKRQSLLNDDLLLTEKTGLYEMPEERSIDIDSELDFEIVEFLLRRKNE